MSKVVTRVQAGIRLVKNMIKLTISIGNTRLNIAELQERYRATKGKVIEFHITDLDYRKKIMLDGGKILTVNYKPPDGGIEMTLDVLMGCLRGETRIYDPIADEFKMQKYGPEQAWRYSDMRVWGTASTNDMLLLFKEVWPVVIPMIKDELQLAEE